MGVKNMKKNNENKTEIVRKKLTTWILVLLIIASASVASLGGIYIKSQKSGISSENNILISQAVTTKEIRYIGGMNEDDSTTTVVAEDGLSFILSMQVNNGDLIK